MILLAYTLINLRDFCSAGNSQPIQTFPRWRTRLQDRQRVLRRRGATSPCSVPYQRSMKAGLDRRAELMQAQLLAKTARSTEDHATVDLHDMASRVADLDHLSIKQGWRSHQPGLRLAPHPSPSAPQWRAARRLDTPLATPVETYPLGALITLVGVPFRKVRMSSTASPKKIR